MMIGFRSIRLPRTCWRNIARHTSTPSPITNTTTISSSPSSSADPISPPETHFKHNDTRPPIARQFKSLVECFLELKSELPPHLLMRLLSSQHKIHSSSNQSDSVLSIAVMADYQPDQAEVLNCLFHGADHGKKLSELLDTPALHHATSLDLIKGNNDSKSTTLLPAIQNSKWTLIPSVEPRLISKEILDNGYDVLFLITNPYHTQRYLQHLPISTFVKHQFPILMIVNGIDNLKNEQADLEYITKTLKYVVVGPNERIFPVSSRRRAVHQYLNAPQSLSDTSGFPELAMYLNTILESPTLVQQFQLRSLAAVLDQIVDHLVQVNNECLNTLQLLDQQFGQKVQHFLANEQERLVHEFCTGDLIRALQPFSKSVDDAKTYLNGLLMVKLLTMDLCQEMKTELSRSYSKALDETKLNLAQSSGTPPILFKHIKSDMKRKVDHLYHFLYTQPLNIQTSTVLAPMLVLLDKIHLSLEQDLKKKSSDQFIPDHSFTLPSMVSRYLDFLPTRLSPLHLEIEQARLHTFLSIGLSWVGVLILFRAGLFMDPFVGLVSGSIFSTGLVFRFKRTWSKFVYRYILALTNAELELKKEISDYYKTLVNDQLAVPMTNIVDQYKLSSQQQHSRIKEHTTVLTSMRNQLEQARGLLSRYSTPQSTTVLPQK